MGKATGVFLILAGVGTAALVLPSVDKDAERQLAEVVRITMGGVAQTPGSTPTKSPPAVATAPPQSIFQPPASSATAAATAAPASPAPPQVLTRNTMASPARPTDTTARADLARDIQKELKRVGCYTGEASGEWTPETRRAIEFETLP